MRIAGGQCYVARRQDKISLEDGYGNETGFPGGSPPGKFSRTYSVFSSSTPAVLTNRVP